MNFEGYGRFLHVRRANRSLRTTVTNYNETWKIKNMFLIANFINFCDGWVIFTCKNVLYTRSYVSIHMGAMYLHERTFFTLADTTAIPMGVMFLHERMFCTLTHKLIHLLFPWVQYQSLKPVLSQCSKIGFVTDDDFIALYL